MSDKPTNGELLRRWVRGGLQPGDGAPMLLPPPITKSIAFRAVEVDGAIAVETDADPSIHANPMGTVHGGVLCTIADAAIGMTHWSSLGEGESFTSIDFKINFFRPVWRDRLRATARAIQLGRSVSYYECDITRADGKLVAHATSTVMTLRGEAAAGR